MTNIGYYDDHKHTIANYVNSGYKLIGLDPGYINLVKFKENETSKLNYTIKQYNFEVKMWKYKSRIVELGKKHNDGTITDEEKKYYEHALFRVRKNADVSFRKLCMRIENKFGKNIILCIGDSGYNEINREIIKVLSKRFISYFVNEYNTSKKCSKCTFPVKKTIIDGKEIRGLVTCTNQKCQRIFNRDNNAAGNMIIKVQNDIVNEKYKQTNNADDNQYWFMG